MNLMVSMDVSLVVPSLNRIASFCILSSFNSESTLQYTCGDSVNPDASYLSFN